MGSEKTESKERRAKSNDWSEEVTFWQSLFYKKGPYQWENSRIWDLNIVIFV